MTGTYHDRWEEDKFGITYSWFILEVLQSVCILLFRIAIPRKTYESYRGRKLVALRRHEPLALSPLLLVGLLRLDAKKHHRREQQHKRAAIR